MSSRSKEVKGGQLDSIVILSFCVTAIFLLEKVVKTLGNSLIPNNFFFSDSHLKASVGCVSGSLQKKNCQ